MTHTIDPITHWLQGDSKVIEFSVSGDDAIDVSGADISWWLVTDIGQDENDAELDGSSDDISVSIVDGPGGRIDVEVAEGATTDLEGAFWHYLRVDPADDSRQTWRGRIRIDV